MSDSIDKSVEQEKDNPQSKWMKFSTGIGKILTHVSKIVAVVVLMFIYFRDWSMTSELPSIEDIKAMALASFFVWLPFLPVDFSLLINSILKALVKSKGIDLDSDSEDGGS